MVVLHGKCLRLEAKYIYFKKDEMDSYSGQIWIPYQIPISKLESPESEACKRIHHYKTLLPNCYQLRAAVIQSVIQYQNLPNFM